MFSGHFFKDSVGFGCNESRREESSTELDQQMRGKLDQKDVAFVQSSLRSRVSVDLQKSGKAAQRLCMIVVRSSKSKLVSWCFQPSQPKRITSGLNTNFILPQSH